MKVEPIGVVEASVLPQGGTGCCPQCASFATAFSAMLLLLLIDWMGGSAWLVRPPGERRYSLPTSSRHPDSCLG